MRARSRNSTGSGNSWNRTTRYLQEEVDSALSFGRIVGRSRSLRHVLQQVDDVASTDATVLITGESGTGKELLAREIHERSRRSQQPFVRVNCSAIPREMFESEFFGHVRGAFTGAMRDRPGRFQIANGGTIFLDEIGDLPLELQPKLLRVLQEGEYERVGEDVTKGRRSGHCRHECRAREHANLMKALQRTDGRIYGAGGAADLLGINPTTLASRLRALKITPPKAR